MILGVGERRRAFKNNNNNNMLYHLHVTTTTCNNIVCDDVDRTHTNESATCTTCCLVTDSLSDVVRRLASASEEQID